MSETPFTFGAKRKILPCNRVKPDRVVVGTRSERAKKVMAELRLPFAPVPTRRFDRGTLVRLGGLVHPARRQLRPSGFSTDSRCARTASG